MILARGDQFAAGGSQGADMLDARGGDVGQDYVVDVEVAVKIHGEGDGGSTGAQDQHRRRRRSVAEDRTEGQAGGQGIGGEAFEHTRTAYDAVDLPERLGIAVESGEEIAGMCEDA